MSPSEDVSIEVERYLSPSTDNWFWRWDDAGEVIVWSASNDTIVFRQELYLILKHLVEQNPTIAPIILPPMDSLVLLLAACRDSWPARADREASPLRHRRLKRQIEVDLFRMLARVHRLPPSIRSTTDGRAALAEVLFEQNHKGVGPERSARIVAEFHRFNPSAVRRREVVSRMHDYLDRTLNALIERAHRPIDPDAITLRMKSGLEQLVAPAEIDVPAGQPVRQLVDELMGDDELSGLAKLTRSVMASLRFCNTRLEEQELPVGGASDITNRGEFDRLLLSELAHDDLTLAARIAVNEALYLRREAPQEKCDSRRALLLDSGIRLWGTPRVFATAVALAMAAVSDKQTQLTAFRAHDADLRVPVDLLTRVGLVNHLSALEPAAHPGPALETFCNQLAEDTMHVDAVLITSEEVLTDRDFRDSLAKAAVRGLYLATVSRDGHFQMRWCHQRQQKLVSEAHLSLEDLLIGRPGQRATPIATSAADRLPAVLSVTPFPLRLPWRVRKGWRTWYVPDRGILTITEDRRLLYWDDAELGPLQLHESMPRGELHWIDPQIEDGVTRAVIGSRHSPGLYLATVSVDTKIVTVKKLATSHCYVTNVCHHAGALFVLGRDTVDVFDFRADSLGSLRIPSGLVYSSATGRFFGDNRHRWYALCFDGRRTRLEEVTSGDGSALPELIHLFDVHGRDGPLGVSPDGRIFQTATGEWAIASIPLGHHQGSWKVAATAVDGSAVAIVEIGQRDMRQPAIVIQGSNRLVYADGTLRGFGPYSDGSQAHTWVNERRRPFLTRQSPLRRRLRCVMIMEDGQLLLQSRRAEWKIIHDRSTDRLRFLAVRTQFRPGDTVVIGTNYLFEKVHRRPKGGYQLRVATLPDGSRIFVDSRGLLHLCSGDRSIPDVTLVLRDDATDRKKEGMAGWCEDGRVWGADYYLVDDLKLTVSPRKIYDEVVQPFMDRLKR